MKKMPRGNQSVSLCVNANKCVCIYVYVCVFCTLSPKDIQLELLLATCSLQATSSQSKSTCLHKYTHAFVHKPIQLHVFVLLQLWLLLHDVLLLQCQFATIICASVSAAGNKHRLDSDQSNSI